MLLATVVSALVAGPGPALPRVAWNDNRAPAGRMAAGALQLDLDIVRGDWRPLGDERAGATVLAFAERGRGASTPGPLIRVRAGTVIAVTVRNTTDDSLVVHGLAPKSGLAALDSIVLAPGAEGRRRFRVNQPGAYFYWGARPGDDLGDQIFDDGPLNGAFIVDPATGPVAPDRILLLDTYTDGRDSTGAPDLDREMLTINGRPWPFTERMTATVGDSVRWRILNASVAPHPMHLHGFYFRVDAHGDWRQDTTYSDAQRRMTVTELLPPGETASIVWSPDRPGGWLFHCHLSFHAVANPPLGAEWPGTTPFLESTYFASNLDHADHHVERHMGGLMMVTNVAPRGPIPARAPAERTLRLEVVASAGATPKERTYGYRMAGGDPSAPPGPAPLLVLQRGQPTDIVILNRTPDATSIHWHGIEIESYSDGVVGVGGYAHMPTPAIMPGDSFVARVTVPRSGSFMYHTHVSDIMQQGKGLAGSIVVVDDLAEYDASHERVYLAHSRVIPENFDIETLVNDHLDSLPADTVVAGRTYRLRLMNLTLERVFLTFGYRSDRAPASWIDAARDGFELPPWQRTPSAEDRLVSIGETRDMLWTPLPGSSGWLEVRTRNGNLIARQRIEVVKR